MSSIVATASTCYLLLFFHNGFKVELTIIIQEHEVAVTAIFTATFLIEVANFLLLKKNHSLPSLVRVVGR